MTERRIKIHQEWANGVGISAEVVKGRELRIDQRKKKRTRQYKIDLLALESVSRKRTKLAWKWMVTGVALLLIVQGVELLSRNDVLMFNIGIAYYAGIAISFICFIMAFKKTSYWQIFYTRNANVPLLKLAIDNPTKKKFSKFVKGVETCIKTAQIGSGLELDEQLIGEMKMLRRLSEEGVVSAGAYEEAKPMLLNKH